MHLFEEEEQLQEMATLKTNPAAHWKYSPHPLVGFVPLIIYRTHEFLESFRAALALENYSIAFDSVLNWAVYAEGPFSHIFHGMWAGNLVLILGAIVYKKRGANLIYFQEVPYTPSFRSNFRETSIRFSAHLFIVNITNSTIHFRIYKIKPFFINKIDAHRP